VREQLPVYGDGERLAQHGEVVVERLRLEARGELLRLVGLEVAHPDLVEAVAPECGKEMVLEGGLLGGQRRVLVVGRRVDVEELLCEVIHSARTRIANPTLKDQTRNQGARARN